MIIKVVGCYIFNQVINDFKYESKKLSEDEINEMVKDKIKEIKIFKIFYGVTQNSEFKTSIEILLNYMISFTIGTYLNEDLTNNFHEIEIWIKGKKKIYK